MFGSQILETAIGVVFVFLLVSIICSAVREGLESLLKSRAAYLEHGIRELLHDREAQGLARRLYEHPLVGGLYGGGYVPGRVSARPSIFARGGSLPSYIPTRNFALALMDIAARGGTTDAVSSDPDSPELSLESMRRNIIGLDNPAVQRVVLAAIDTAEGKLGNARATIEAWYDGSMDRVSGWYKRSTSWIIFFIGVAVAVALNVNTITLVDFLYRDDAAREALVARAQTAVADTGFIHRSIAETRATLDSAALPIGWSRGWGAPFPRAERQSLDLWNDVLGPVLGLLVTGLAATFGAPFWFDLLNKIMVVRSTVKPHEKSREESSEDRQKPLEKTVAVRAPLAPASGIASEAGVETAGPAPGTLPPRRLSPLRASPRDATSGLDGCDVEMSGPTVVATSDEDLPPSEGGVA